MRVCYVLAVAIFAFLSSGESLAGGAESRRTNNLVLTSNGNRLLRGSKTDLTEERGIIQVLKEETTKMANMAVWVNMGKSDDFVKQALGLEKLSGKTLKANANYKVFKEFQAKMDEPKITAWLNKDTTTSEVWSALGLSKLTKEEAKTSRDLQTYISYAKRLDDDIWNHKRASFEPEFPSPAELGVKAQLWAKAGRPQWYVFEMMGKSALKGNQNYEYYQLFLKLLRKQSRKAKVATN